jgi:hypothetical protein
MELAAIQLNMRVFSDQHLDDPAADVVAAVAVMCPWWRSMTTMLCRWGPHGWKNSWMVGSARAASFSLDLSRTKRKKKGFGVGLAKMVPLKELIMRNFLPVSPGPWSIYTQPKVISII